MSGLIENFFPSKKNTSMAFIRAKFGTSDTYNQLLSEKKEQCDTSLDLHIKQTEHATHGAIEGIMDEIDCLGRDDIHDAVEKILKEHGIK